jgi:hypothetical protein
MIAPGRQANDLERYGAGASRPALGPAIFKVPLSIRKERSMTNPDDEEKQRTEAEEKQNMRIMWIASGVVVVFFLVIAGLSMMSERGTGPTDMSSQSRSAPVK